MPDLTPEAGPGILFGFLPVLVESALAVAVLGRSTSWMAPLGVRGALVLAGATTVGWAVAGALILSVFASLTRLPSIVWWTAGAVIALALAGPRWKLLPAAWSAAVMQRRLRTVERAALGAILVIALCALLMGVFSPPNNADSLKYHLSRELFWVARHSVFLADAPFPHMLTQPPLAEYLGVHLLILTGSDRLNNLVQFAAWMHCLLLITLLGRAAGAGRVGQLGAALFFATFPAAFHQASNTKNDLILTAFLLALLWVIAALPKRAPLRLDAAMATGFFAGGALLTKGTAVAYLPVIGLFGLANVTFRRIAVPLRAVVLFLILAASIPASHYLGQARAIHAAEAGAGSQHVNGRIDPAAMLSVLVRNLAVQMATPSTWLNGRFEQAVAAIHEAIGLDLNDATTTFQYGDSFAVAYRPREEDRPPAFFHFSLFLLLPVLGAALPQGRRRRAFFGYTVLAWAMLFAFSAMFRWQPWHARLLIPVVAAGATPAGMWVAANRSAFIAATVAMLLLLDWWPSLESHQRPLLGKGSIVFQPASTLRIATLPADQDIIDGLNRIIVRARPARMIVDTEDATTYPILRTLLHHAEEPVVLCGPRESCGPDVDAMLVHRTARSPASRPPPAVPGLARTLDQGGWSLWLRPELAAQVHGPDLYPVFYGFDRVAGLGPVEGPLPAWGLPLFRNARAPEVEIDVRGSAEPRILLLELRPYQGPQSTRVVLAGQTVGRLDVDPATAAPARLAIPLGIRSEHFQLRLEFCGGSSPATPPPALARVTRLQILPESALPR